jgi:hypothetical protein
VIRLLGAVIDLVLRLMPTPKEQKDSASKKKRDENQDRINRAFTGTSGIPWWVR